tara:strand:+ start:4990 stop:5199 length:210 start_codon:yes stop_codon:yes gene_type:complete
MKSFYKKRNGSALPKFFYPVNGNKNVLREIEAGAEKLRSFTGPNGQGVVARETNGNVRSFSTSKTVASL